MAASRQGSCGGRLDCSPTQSRGLHRLNAQSLNTQHHASVPTSSSCWACLCGTTQHSHRTSAPTATPSSTSVTASCRPSDTGSTQHSHSTRSSEYTRHTTQHRDSQQSFRRVMIFIFSLRCSSTWMPFTDEADQSCKYSATHPYTHPEIGKVNIRMKRVTENAPGSCSSAHHV